MATFLTECVPVSLSGSLGNAGNYNLFSCDQPNVVLYVARQPRLMLDSLGKPGVAVTTYTTQQEDGSVKIASGAATIAINTAPEMDAGSIEQAKALVAQQGVADPNQVRFLPLTTQKGKARLNLPTVAGAADAAHNERDVGTPGGSLSFLANLTEVGALEWAQAIRTGSRVNGDITISYEYLRRMPDIGAEVRVHGSRVFEHLSAALDVSYNGFFYGGGAKLEAAWNDLTRNGGVEVVFLNQGLPPDLEQIRQEMVKTFSQQAMQILFEQIFAPMPQVAPAQAPDAGGIFGGANFALKWQRTTDAIEMKQLIQFRGTTWLTQSMDISLAALFAGLDPACLTEVPAQQAFESKILVDGDEQLANVSASMTWSEGRSPTAPVFGPDGGQEKYTVVSTHPGDVVVDCIAKINYEPAKWPVMNFPQKQTVREGGNMMVIKPSTWVGRTQLYLFVVDNGKITRPNPDDYLVLNVSYEGPHLTNPLRESGKLDPINPIRFDYPLDPQGRPGVAKFSAFGVLGGKLRQAPEKVIPNTDQAVFILADVSGDIKLVTSTDQVPEAGSLAGDLVRGQGKPIVVDMTPVKPTPETGKPRPKAKLHKRPPARNGRYGKDHPPTGTTVEVFTGTTTGVEYGSGGISLWVKLADGSSRRVRLNSAEDWSAFEKDSRYVEVHLDAGGEYAEYIRTTLTV
jgi:hypothetical protein